jgi:zinc ribbon protein
MYCVHCGAENPADATFCQKCGKQLPVTVQDEPTISSIPSNLPTSYENTPYSNTPSNSADTVYAPPPPIPYAPTTSAKTSTPVQKPKSRRGLIITLAIVVIVAVIAAGAYFYLNRSTPDKTVTTYYSALVQNDFQTAYNQCSTAFQNSLSEQNFASIWLNQGGVKAWTLVSTQEQGSIAHSTVTVTFGNGQIRLATIDLVNENGAWKINKETFAGS